MRAVLKQKLPSPERAQFIVDQLRAGVDPRDISRAINRKNTVEVRHTIAAIGQDVDAYDTFIDDVAVERAYKGDRPVWLALTHYERRACLDLLMGRALAGRDHIRWPGLPAVEPGCEPGWLGLWAVEVGEPPRRWVRILVARRSALARSAS